MDSAFGFCRSDNNIPISHLDYKYIGNCQDAKEIEKLLKILRSGEEGSYPDLIKFTEDRLCLLNPKSKMLLKENPIKSVKDIIGDEGNSLMDDLKSWSEHMTQMDETIRTTNNTFDADYNYPPIRTSNDKQETKEPLTEDNSEKRPAKRVTPRSYGEWEKIDVEKEINKVDTADHSTKHIRRENKPIISEMIIDKDVPEEEKPNRANLEKEKGNEAFKAGDYEEAIVYYNRSLSIHPVTAVYNNRAITFIKMSKFEDAIKDCNTVLKEEADNIKALLRRVIAMKSMKRYQNAKEDLKSVLTLAPDNKRAKGLFEEVSKLIAEATVNGHTDAEDEKEELKTDTFSDPKDQEQTDRTKRGKRLIIEEVDNSEKSTEEISKKSTERMENSEKSSEIPGNENQSKQEVKSKGKRLKIVEVDDVADVENSVEKEDLQKICDITMDESWTGKGESRGETNESLTERRSANDQEARMNVTVEQHDKLNSSRTSETPATDDRHEDLSSPQHKIGGQDLEGKKNEASSVVLSPPVVTAPKSLPENVVVLKDKGNALYKIGRYADAIECYSDAINQLTEDATSYASSIAVLLSNRSTCRLKIGDCRGCIDDASESLKLMPSTKALLRRASAYETLEKYRNAYVDYQAALRLDANASSAWQASTRLIKILKDLDGPKWREKLPKMEEFDNVQNQTMPNNQNMASFERSRPSKPNETSNAKNGGEEREDLDRKSEQGEIQAKKTESREEQFKRIKETGNKFVQQGHYEKAADCYSQCMDLIPDEAVSYTNREMCYLKLNKPNMADADCTKALALQPNNIKALYRRALARKTGVRYQDALQDLNDLLNFDPNNVVAKKELEIIKNLWKKQTKQRTEELKMSPKTKDHEKIMNNNGKDGNAKGSKLKIEEIKTEKEVGESETQELNNRHQKKGKKLKIIEVDEYEDDANENKMKEEKVLDNDKRNIKDVRILNDEKLTKEVNSKTEAGTSKDESSVAKNECTSKSDESLLASKESLAGNKADSSVGDGAECPSKNRAESSSEYKVDSSSESKVEPSSDNKADSSTAKRVESSSASRAKSSTDSKAESSSDYRVESSSDIKESSSENNESSSRVEAVLPDEVVRFKDEGNSLYKRGRYADAIECYTAAINIIQQDATSYASSIAVLLSNRSTCRLKIGDCRGCIDDATESLKLMPSTKALLRRASAYETLEKYREAYNDYQMALRIDANVKSAWDASSRLIKVLKDLDGPKWREKLPKVESFSNFFQARQKSSPVTIQNGQSGTDSNKIDKEDRSEEEKKFTEKELDTKQNDDEKTESEVKKEETKRTETKDDKFKRIKESGNRFVQQEKYQEAANCYSQCIDLLPNEVASYTNRALCYLKLNKPKKAVTDCSKALTLQPNNVKALFRRALAKKASMKYMEALQDLTSLLKIEPQNAAASKELEIIKGLWREELKNTQVKQSENKKSKEATPEVKQKPGKNKTAKTEGNLKSREINGQKDTLSPKKATSGAKKATKEPTSQKPQIKKISGFEFLQAWNELKGKSLKEHADLLAQVEPTQLPKVLSNKIDGDMIQTIVSCVQEFFLTKDKLLLGFNILRYMSKAERFNMAVMFLSTSDLSKIKKVVEEMESKLRDTNSGITAKEMNDFKRAYKVTL